VRITSVACAYQALRADSAGYAVTADEANIALVASTVEADAVGSTEIADGSITAADIDNTSVQQRVTNTASSGYYITGINVDGSITTAVDQVGTGDITGVTAGSGLSGGGAAGTVTLSVPTGGITGTHIALNTISQEDIGTGGVASDEIADNSIGQADIATSGVGSSEIATGAVYDADINASAAIAPSKISGTAATLSATQTFSGATNAFNNKVGIGITSPDAYSRLHVAHNSYYAGLFNSNYLSPATHIVHAEYNGGAGNADVRAVYGKAIPNDYYGYGGYFEGGYIGVFGSVSPTGNNHYYGVYGEVSGGSGTNYGVYGYAYGGSTNWAGYFNGDVRVTGTFDNSKSGIIMDHPLNPDNQYLYHSSINSPNMMNVYNGNVVLDSNGEAVVRLPDYFEALNRDFRYQLTCIGGFAPVYIAEKISGNNFRIAGGIPGMEVSWQVTGIRHDKWANANRIQVEVDKPDNEIGLYIHPEAYGLGEEKDIHYEQRQKDKREMEEVE
ncbi:MAG: hypothetical protein ACE5D6_07595, partial [Candidatus Zixiibacteriota bacterium]